MAILRRLLTAFLLALALSPALAAQSVTVIDGSQTNLVIVSRGASTSSGSWITWRSKFIPEHVIFQYTQIGSPAAVNPQVRCTLDDQSQNPNDQTIWFQIAITGPNSGSGLSFDVGGPSMGGTGSISSGSTVTLAETGVFPCVSWAIAPAGTSGAITGTYKITAVQLPASGDATFLSSANQIVESGAIRTVSTTPCAGGGCPSPGSLPVPIQNSTNTGIFYNTVPQFLSYALADANPNTNNFLGCSNGVNGVVSGCVNRDHPFLFNGSTWDRQFYCPKTGSTTALAAATAQIIAGVAGQLIRICSILMSNTNATGTTVAIVEGTGVNCATGQTTLIPAVSIGPNTLADATEFFGPSTWFTITTGDALCATSSAASSVNIAVNFAQY